MSKKQYISPSANRSISLYMETKILAASVVESFNTGGVETAGQTVQEKDFSDETHFSHDWE